MSGGEIEFLTQEELNIDPEMSAEAHQKWLNEKEEIQEKFREFLVQVAEAEKIRNPLNAFGDIMITSGITTEFEKLSHQEKYQAVRDTQIMAQMKEKVIKQHDETSKDGAVPVDACVWGNSDQAYDTPHTGRYNL